MHYIESYIILLSNKMAVGIEFKKHNVYQYSVQNQINIAKYQYQPLLTSNYKSYYIVG